MKSQIDYDVAIIEDEADLGNVVSEYLKLRGFLVIWFISGEEALTYYQEHQHKIKLLIIDIHMPGMNGFEFSLSIMKLNPKQTFLFLTAHNEKHDRLRGLKIGAIDYIAKPFDIQELVLRIGNIITKFNPEDVSLKTTRSGILNIGDIQYHRNQLFIRIGDDKEISLTVREAEVFDYLSSNVNTVVKKKDLLVSLWGDEDYFNGKSLEVFVSRLRRILKSSALVKIDNVYGLGYVLSVR